MIGLRQRFCISQNLREYAPNTKKKEVHTGIGIRVSFTGYYLTIVFNSLVFVTGIPVFTLIEM